VRDKLKSYIFSSEQNPAVKIQNSNISFERKYKKKIKLYLESQALAFSDLCNRQDSGAKSGAYLRPHALRRISGRAL